MEIPDSRDAPGTEPASVEVKEPRKRPKVELFVEENNVVIQADLGLDAKDVELSMHAVGSPPQITFFITLIGPRGEEKHFKFDIPVPIMETAVPKKGVIKNGHLEVILPRDKSGNHDPR